MTDKQIFENLMQPFKQKLSDSSYEFLLNRGDMFAQQIKERDRENYAVKLCMKLWSHSIHTNKTTQNMTASEIKNHLRIFFEDEIIEKAIAVLSGEPL